MESAKSARTAQSRFSARSHQSGTPTETWNAPVPSVISQSTKRPITQHGVEGMPVPPSSHVQKRMYYDKRYYSTAVQSHMNKIREEIANLNSKTAKNKPASASLNEDRRMAKEEAKVYAKYQQQLSVLNIALEMHLSRIGNDQAVLETAEINKKNTSMTEELDRLFFQKTRCEETKNALEEEMKQEEQRKQLLINKLQPGQVEEYETYSKENEKFLRATSETQCQIKEIKAMLGKLKETITYDNMKQNRIKLLLKLDSSQTHLKNLRKHLEDVPAEKERETLLKQLKDDKADAETLQKVKVSMEEQLKEKNNQLNGLNNELDSKNSARLKKYRDVHVRHAQVNSYIDMFDEVVANIRVGIAEKERYIALCLDYLLEKTSEDDVDEVDDNSVQTENLTDEFKILRSKLSRLTDVKQRLGNEENNLKEKLTTMKNEMVTFRNIDQKKDQIAEEAKVAEDKQKSLKSVLSTTAAAVNDAQTRLEKFESVLEKNDTYREFVNVGKELEQIEVENEKVEEEIKSRTTSDEITNLTEEIMNLAKQKNEILIQNLKSK